MNPYRDPDLNPRDAAAAQSPGLSDDSNNPSSSGSPSPPLIQTGHSSVSLLPLHQASSDKAGDPNRVPAPNPDRSTLPLPASDSGFSSRSRSQSISAPAPHQSRSSSAAPVSTPNPYPALGPAPTCQVSVIIVSPEPQRPPLTSQCSEESLPDLECSICFSQFNNVFRCPKMLHCRHTFCLECLARINVKAAEPSAIQCPLCRSFTPLPALGLPKLSTDPDVLSYLPAAMQRVYSIRFHRNKGKLEVKRSSEGRQRWGQRSLTSLRSVHRSLDVGLPSPPIGGRRGDAGGVGGALFRLTGRPVCRAILLTSVVMMMVLLTGILIILLNNKP